MKPEVGMMATTFTSSVIGGEFIEEESLSLEDLRGERVVLVFYPKDNTPGCTIQGCALRDHWSDLEGKARVFGVSPDPIESHKKFIDKRQLPYPLISDSSKTIVEAYGVWVQKQMFGKKFMSTERSSFVMDEEGRIMAVLEKVKPTKHVDQLLEVLG
jgi:peroxiredoxin Q/BCP